MTVRRDFRRDVDGQFIADYNLNYPGRHDGQGKMHPNAEKALAEWIQQRVTSRKTADLKLTQALKVMFENEAFYISQEELNAALFKAGYRRRLVKKTWWAFNVKLTKP